MKVLLALGSVGAMSAMDVTSSLEERIASDVNTHVCDGYGDYPVDGEFDVVGFAQDILGAAQARGLHGGRGGHGGHGGHPAQRGAGNFPGRGGAPGAGNGVHPAQAMQMALAAHQGGMHPTQLAQMMSAMGMLPQGPMGMMMPPGTPAPGWFQSALGVSPPMELMNTCSLVAETNGGVFSPTVTSIKYSARPQRPFRGERPVATPFRSAGVLGSTTLTCQPIFVGVIPQAVEIGVTDIAEWAPNAFGVRLAMTDAAQGTLISVLVGVAGSAIPAGESITLPNITLYGRALA